MKTIIKLALVAVIFITYSCDKESATLSDELTPVALKGGVDVERPFKIKKVEGNYSIIPVFGELCPALVLNAFGEGTITHLGNSTILEEWCWSGAQDDLGTRSITITAANGDELRGYHSTIEFINNSPITFVETLNFNGGTGRFENATGVFIETVVVTEDFPGALAGTFVMSGEGTIIY